MNKVEIIYTDGTWILLNGAGEVVIDMYKEYSYGHVPVEVAQQIMKEFGLDRE